MIVIGHRSALLMRVVLLLALWVGVAVGMTACGKKGPPIPPERLRPVSVQGIQAESLDSGVRLLWRAPLQKINGQPIERLSRFDLFRAEGATREACTGAAARWARLETIAMGDEPLDRLFSFLDTSVVPGTWYSYRIVAVDLDGNVSDDAPSLPLIFRGTPPPQAPSPATQAGDGFVTLRMPAFPEYVLGWRLFRSAADEEELDLFPLFSAAVTEAEYTDGGVQNDRWYRYSAAWLAEEEGFLQQGELSPPVAARPVDLTPPLPPRQIVAIARPGRLVELRWERVAEPRVRYHVYRRAAEHPGLRRLTKEPISVTIFEDRPGRGTYFYVVTSLDLSSNESSRSEPSQVQVR